jgi:hypothetical protein
MAALYRVVWFFVMVLVAAPAFLMAGFVDGVSYQEAADIVASGVDRQFPLPTGLIYFLTPAITILARLFPASSLVAVFPGQMLWEGIGIILVVIFFALVKPPFYAAVERKYGAVSNAKYVGGMRSMTFGRAAAMLVCFWLVMEIFYGFARNPLDDRWVGEVNLVKPLARDPKPLDIKLTLEMLDPGFVMNRRDDVRERGVRLTFDGPQVSVLRQRGISESLFASPERWKFSQGYCEFHSEEATHAAMTSYMKDYTYNKAVLDLIPKGTECPRFELGVVSFNEINYRIIRPGEDVFSKKDQVYAQLKRDSRVSPIQRLIMWARFSSWADHATFRKS